MKKALVLASGNGSLFEHLAVHLESHSLGNARVEALVTSSSKAFALERAEKLSVDSCCIDSKSFSSLKEWDLALSQKIKEISPDLIVLAGFLKKIGQHVLNLKIPIINIHPSLLPKHSGKGMYGLNVHKAVIKSGDNMSGSTIHWVNKDYDGGQLIGHIKVNIDSSETPESLQSKVKEIEKDFLLDVVSQILCE